MVLLVVFLGALVTYTSGLAQDSSSSATAVAKANAAASGGSASATAYSSTTASSGNNGKGRDCTYNRCTPTCSIPNPENCPKNSNPCNCPSGTIISDQGGKCVQTEQCQKYINCKGDYNATYTDCPIACPSTCARPNAQYCNTRCATPGCECNYGYLLSSKKGKCIKAEDCPGGYVCGPNQVFVGCLVECPDLYCPTNEFRVACSIASPCPSGCGCKRGYLRKSVNDHTCIPIPKCPPGKCSRPNEEWNTCVPACFSDSCKDRKTIEKNCPVPPSDCFPGCLCKEDYYRNDDGVCVPVQECPATG